MDCKVFRDQHAPYVDLRCSAVEEAEMRQHLRECPTCSRHDTVVRRSLMLVKSLPSIEPSPDFQARLYARLHATAAPAIASQPLRAPYAAFVALAAGVAFVAFLAASAMRSAAPSEIRMAPVIASIPEFEPAPVATPALVATVPTGMSVWPAIMVASQAPIHFVATEMATDR